MIIVQVKLILIFNIITVIILCIQNKIVQINALTKVLDIV